MDLDPEAGLEDESGADAPTDPSLTLGARRRLEQAHELWHQALEAYPDADAFCLGVNALIPALRSVTFLLQKDLSHEDGFEAWYAIWQERLREDPVMRWAVEARNHIEKVGDLDLHSTARVLLIDSWLPGPVLELQVPALLPPDLIAARFAEEDLPPRVREEGLLRVTRRWVTASLPDWEVIDACAHTWSVLGQLVRDAEERFRGGSADPIASFERRPCMVLGPDARTATIHLASNTFVEHQSVVSPVSVADREAAEERYGAVGSIPKPEDSLEGRVRWYHEIARIMLAKDGRAASVAFVMRKGRRVHMASIDAEDQQEKYLLMEQLAKLVVASGGDEVILTSEAWIAQRVPPTDGRFHLRAAQREDRGEGLQTLGADASGGVIASTSVFARVDNGIVLGESITATPPVALLLGPVLKAWGLDPLRGGHITTGDKEP